MKRILEINGGSRIVTGDDKRMLQCIFKELIDKFTQRKSFDEYYYQ